MEKSRYFGFFFLIVVVSNSLLTCEFFFLFAGLEESPEIFGAGRRGGLCARKKSDGLENRKPAMGARRILVRPEPQNFFTLYLDPKSREPTPL